mmetsp:Transcript_10800/g.17469  ORF Transcript_10800/g.17469 Transcript_10800/m.17469 type:complete len:96 (+) Transcript_10800:159-446(+)
MISPSLMILQHCLMRRSLFHRDSNCTQDEVGGEVASVALRVAILRILPLLLLPPITYDTMTNVTIIMNYEFSFMLLLLLLSIYRCVIHCPLSSDL